jgi:outer membrane protein TolC
MERQEKGDGMRLSATSFRGAATVLLAAVASVLLASCGFMNSGPAADSYVGPMDENAAKKLDLSERLKPTTAAASPKVARAAVPEEGPITLTVEQAMLMALEHNRSLSVARINPNIAQTAEEEARAVFDPVLTLAYALEQNHVSPQETANVTHGRSGASELSAGLSQFLPTGTIVALDATASHARTVASNYLNSSRAGLTVTQALLQGCGLEVNLVSVRQARLDVLSTQYELRGFAESLLAQTEETYWRDVLAQRRIVLYEDSLKLAEKQLAEAEQRVEVGALAPTEVAAAKAEVALRREGLINARGALATTRLTLLRLVNPPGAGLWNRPLVTASQPAVPAITLDPVDAHVELALRLRSDLNQARLGVQRNDLELVRTKDGLLPRMDLFVALGRTGYANTFARANYIDFWEGNSYDASAGLSFEFPPLNRAGEAAHRRATLTRQQSAEALANLEQLVQVDVRAAYIEVQRSREQVTATTATRQYQEENLRVETEKFKEGKSTSLLVAQVQRDLLSAQIAEVVAVVNHMISLVELYRLDGSLLIRAGIAAPGAEPVSVDPAVTAAGR